MRVLRDSAGQTEPAYLTRESYKGHSYDTPHALFTPVSPEAQYAICSPIVDKNGTIYFKNDSANLMAFGSALTDMTVTKDPDKKEYAVGETFEPKSLTVLITDHHSPADTLPAAYAIVNPKRHDETYPFKDFCGAGVILKVMFALADLLGQDKSEVCKSIDLAAMATQRSSRRCIPRSTW